MHRSIPFLEISLTNCIANLRELRARAGEHAAVIAVVKDSAYGCGAVMISRELEQAGVTMLAVARSEEAHALRDAGIHLPVLIFGDCSSDEMQRGTARGFRFTLNDIGSLDTWRQSGVPLAMHCNVDTGMSRLGISEKDADDLLSFLTRNPHISLEGMFTHFPCADEPGTPTVERQYSTLQRLVDRLRGVGFHPRYIHAANSAAVVRFPAKGWTACRPGIALYGCRPDPAQEFDVELKPVVAFKSRVIKVTPVDAGTPVSYGAEYVAPSATRIATIAAGYAHGISRKLGNRGSVLIRGRRFPVSGRVTMDYTMVDIGLSTAVAPGDEVVLLGRQGTESISVDEMALLEGTIGYEILCRLGMQCDRYYLRNGLTVAHVPGYRL